MAARKKLQTAAVLDNSAKAEKSKIMYDLPSQQFNNVICWIKNAPLESIGMLRTATFKALKRLAVNRDLKKAVKGMPNGSAQGDLRSVLNWMDKIQPGYKQAIKQLVAIDATCCARSD